AKGQPDIRGWEVREEKARKIGEVQELIFDVLEHKVRYMVVQVMDSDELELEKRTVLIPIGLAELHQKDDDVILHGVTAFQLRALPKYNKENLGARAEGAVGTVFGRKHTSLHDDTNETDMTNEYYEHEHFNEKNLYRNRKNVADVSLEKDSRDTSSQYKQQMTEAEAVALRRDADLGRPVSNLEEERLSEQRRQHNVDLGRHASNSEEASLTEERRRKENAADDFKGKRENETDEEYVRRARRNIDNRS
ncbi:MAG: PRC-barrel domain-containing protein, partial [Bacteroidota bacterium]